MTGITDTLFPCLIYPTTCHKTFATKHFPQETAIDSGIERSSSPALREPQNGTIEDARTPDATGSGNVRRVSAPTYSFSYNADSPLQHAAGAARVSPSRRP